MKGEMSTKSMAVTVTCLIGALQQGFSKAFPLASTPRCNGAYVRSYINSQPSHRRYSAPKPIQYHTNVKFQPQKRRILSQLHMSDSGKSGDHNATSELHLDDETISFMGLDEADELFFNSMAEINSDRHIDTENADELMKVLQEMIDNNSVSVIDDDDFAEMDEETLMEILGYSDEDEENEQPLPSPAMFEEQLSILNRINGANQFARNNDRGMRDLEHALMQGVVPADAGVGSGMLPGDIGFDPLELSTKDYFKQIQMFILNMLPERKNKRYDDSESDENSEGAALPVQGFVGEEERPPALILRDYREAEIRHGRLAMLAAAIWPLQEIFDRIFIPETFGSMTIVYGGTTLPFLPLLMTFMMLNLGYLDIYSSEIKENESGDAFLPGECFWDPLCIMEGAPDQMKWNMQEREIMNGRAAMIAVAAFTFEEAMTHRPVITIGRNDFLFEPVYQVPVIQAWLDQQFGSVGETIMVP